MHKLTFLVLLVLSACSVGVTPSGYRQPYYGHSYDNPYEGRHHHGYFNY